jgi:hypothetical protein
VVIYLSIGCSLFCLLVVLTFRSEVFADLLTHSSMASRGLLTVKGKAIVTLDGEMSMFWEASCLV